MPTWLRGQGESGFQPLEQAPDGCVNVPGTASLIFRNSASGNTTNPSIVASNRYRSIIDITAHATAAASGSAPVGTLTTTTKFPGANFACRENAAGFLNLLLCFPHSICLAFAP